MAIIVGSALTNANDTLLGTSGNDTLSGYGGNDVLRGGAGNDVLEGGKGGDILTGGLGADSFIFHGGDMTRGAGRDVITDFQDGVDHILLDHLTISPKAVTISDLYAADGHFVGARIETEGLANTLGPNGGAFIDLPNVHAADLQIGTDLIWV